MKKYIYNMKYLGVYPKDSHTTVNMPHWHMHSYYSTVPNSYVINQLRCLSVEEWIRKLVRSAEGNVLATNRGKLCDFIGKWRQLEIILVNQVNLRKASITHCALIHGLRLL